MANSRSSMSSDVFNRSMHGARFFFEEPERHVAPATEQAAHLPGCVAVINVPRRIATRGLGLFQADRAQIVLCQQHRSKLLASDAVGAFKVEEPVPVSVRLTPAARLAAPAAPLAVASHQRDIFATRLALRCAAARWNNPGSFVAPMLSVAGFAPAPGLHLTRRERAQRKVCFAA